MNHGYAHPTAVGDHQNYEERIKRAYRTADRSGQPQWVHRHPEGQSCDPKNPCARINPAEPLPGRPSEP